MLYIVSTPIGNLDDLSLRQARTLVASDYILAEDTRSVQTLLNAMVTRFKLKTSGSTLISYYKEKEFEKLPFILDLLKQDKIVSLVSESGTPLISDPGYLLVKTVIKEKLPMMVIPGPSALTTSVLYSSFNPANIMYLGFLPKKTSAILQLIDRMKMIKHILHDIIFVFYESPKRINDTLKLLDQSIPDADICICREMTKKFEEIIRGKPKELLNRTYKGEISMVIKL